MKYEKSVLLWSLKLSYPSFFAYQIPYKWVLQDMEAYNKFMDRFKGPSKEQNPAASKGKVW